MKRASSSRYAEDTVCQTIQLNTPSLRRRLIRVAGFPLVLATATLLWLEDWLWDPLARQMQHLATLPLVRAAKDFIRAAPPWLALALYGIPMLVLLPFKFAGIWLFARGHYVFGACIFMLAKISSTAVAAFLFSLTRPSLMRMDWFARLYERFLRLREYVYGRVHRNPAWRLARLLHCRLRRLVHKLRRAGSSD